MIHVRSKIRHEETPVYLQHELRLWLVIQFSQQRQISRAAVQIEVIRLVAVGDSVSGWRNSWWRNSWSTSSTRRSCRKTENRRTSLHPTRDASVSDAASPKFWEGSNILTLSEQQYLVLDTASWSTKQQDMLEILGGMVIFTPLATPTLSAQALAKYKADFWFRIEAYYLD